MYLSSSNLLTEYFSFQTSLLGYYLWFNLSVFKIKTTNTYKAKASLILRGSMQGSCGGVGVGGLRGMMELKHVQPMQIFRPHSKKIKKKRKNLH